MSTKLTLPRSMVFGLIEAILSIDSEKSVCKFDAKTRYGLAKNARILRSKAEDYEKVRAGLVKDLSPADGTPLKDSPEAFAAFAKQWEAFILADEEIEGILSIKSEDLKLDVNDIPIRVLVGLSPILLD